MYIEISTKRQTENETHLHVERYTYLVIVGKFMLLDSTFCEEGDRAILKSSRTEIEKWSYVLEFAFYENITQNDNIAALSIFAYLTQGGLVKRHLMTISRDNTNSDVLEMKQSESGSNGWKYVAFILPIGNYAIAFEATCGLAFESNIAIDNVELRMASGSDKLQNGTRLREIGSANFSIDLESFDSKIK